MSRNQVLVLVLGLLMMVFGFTLDMFRQPAQKAVARGTAAEAESEQQVAPAQRVAATAATDGAEPEEARATGIELGLAWEDDGTPAADVAVDLWRRAMGEGAARRSARRLATGKTTDAEGRLALGAPAGFALDLVLRTGAAAAPIEVPVEALAKGERRHVTLQVPRPPARLALLVEDAATGAPIPGASIRIISRFETAPEDFPGSSRLVARTDAHGQCELEGSVRRSPRLLIDAAGFGPAALDPADVVGRVEATVRLSAAASLVVHVKDPGDAPVPGAEVQARFTVAGHTSTVTTASDRRGRADLRRLPAGVPVWPIVTSPSGRDTVAPAAENLDPGEEREVHVRIENRDG